MLATDTSLILYLPLLNYASSDEKPRSLFLIPWSSFLSEAYPMA
jgi:hypothetical protein